MTAPSSTTRWTLAGAGAAVLLGLLLVNTVPFVGMAWGTLTGGPDLWLVRDLRETLLDQPRFRETLSTHEQRALDRHGRTAQTSYQARHLVQVNLTPMGLPGFHDVFATRVRTDVVDGQPYTSFLVRPGAVADPNSIPFFSRQCESSLCTSFLEAFVGTGHWLLRQGVLTSFRLNVTEMDETSSVFLGREAISTDAWATQSQSLHAKGVGRSFSPTDAD